MQEKSKTLIKHATIIGLVISLLTFTFSILVGEYIVRHTLPQNTYNFARLRGMNIFDSTETLPITLQKDVKDYDHIAYTLEFRHKVDTNSQGIRGREISLEKPQNTYRILLLGDSMTFGWGVNEEETFAKVLENNLNTWSKESNLDTNFEVINAGFTGGKTLDSYYVFLNEMGLKYKPDLVVLNLFPYNDVTDLLEMNWDEVDERGLPHKITSKFQSTEDGYIVNIYQKNWIYEIPVVRNTHLGILLMSAMEKGSPNTVKKIKKSLGFQENPPKSISQEEAVPCLSNITATNTSCVAEILQGIEKSKTLIAGINDLVTQNQSAFIVTILTDPQQAKSIGRQIEDGYKLEEEQPQREFRDFLNDKKIANLDFLKFMAVKNSQDYYFERDGHFNVPGHKRTGNLLSAFIAQNYLPTVTINQEFLKENQINPSIDFALK
ncbi:MAG: SGNH/GDSL hydrolase family protein [Candidatus Curtissbacteria bacterium]|nr:SGNH/GDSL hydrolase family protein [Candidatus Curtissbacteria bacterium]